MFKHSQTKEFINEFLASRCTSQSTVLVIDADQLMSSKAFMNNGVLPANITVLNSDQGICDKAKSFGLNAVCGVSTNVLREIYGEFDVIYLDYCGFPQRKADGFDPAFDLLWAADHTSGIVVATFSRRAPHCIEQAENLIPNSLQLAKTYVYRETSAMMCMFMVKNNPRELRHSINRALLMTPVEPVEPHAKRKLDMSVERKARKAKRRRYFCPPEIGRRVQVLFTYANGSQKWDSGIVVSKMVECGVNCGKFEVEYPNVELGEFETETRKLSYYHYLNKDQHGIAWRFEK